MPLSSAKSKLFKSFADGGFGVAFRISGFGEKSVEAARQVLGSRIGTAHDR